MLTFPPRAATPSPPALFVLEMVAVQPLRGPGPHVATCEVRIEGHRLSSFTMTLVQQPVESIQENDATYEQPDKNQPSFDALNQAAE